MNSHAVMHIMLVWYEISLLDIALSIYQMGGGDTRIEKILKILPCVPFYT